jgi:hypothetical protein
VALLLFSSLGYSVSRREETRQSEKTKQIFTPSLNKSPKTSLHLGACVPEHSSPRIKQLLNCLIPWETGEVIDDDLSCGLVLVT